MKRLLLDVTTITNDMTGVSRYGIELVREIVKCPEIELILIVHSDLSKKHELFDICRGEKVCFEFLTVGGIGPIREWRFYKLSKKLKNKFDVFHSITSNAPLAFYSKGAGTFHDLKYVLFPQYMGKFGSLKSFFIRCQFALICFSFKKITCSSQSTLNDLLKVYPFMKRRILSKASVVYLGLTPLKVNKELTKPLPVDEPYFIYVGELRPHKNIFNMIKAFESFTKKTGFKGRFLIGGKLHNSLNLKSEDKRIIFLGRVEDEDLGYLYSRSLGLFFASRYEGFGLPILEAMKLNTPVITSSVSSMPEVGGDAALIVDPDSVEEMAKSLEELAFNEGIRKDLIQKSEIQVDKFSWHKCANEMIKIYFSI